MIKRIIVLVVLSSVIMFNSCYYVWPVYEEEISEPEDIRNYIQISSSNIFVCNGKACILCKSLLPAKVYNPNNYSIVVTIDGVDYVILPLEELTLKETP